MPTGAASVFSCHMATGTGRGRHASMRPVRYRITTLGCRVNHAETREMESVLLSRGLVRAAKGETADLEVVHTCSVTHTAAAKSRHSVRRAARRLVSGWPGISDPDDPFLEPGESGGARRPPRLHGPPPPQVIVTGCFGATDADDAARLAGGPQQVVVPDRGDGSAPAERFAQRVDQWLAGRRAPRSLRTHAPGSCPQPASPGPVVRPLPVVPPRAEAGSHVRAELKIQDGCDAHCSFCIIPRIRRTLRSKTVHDAVDEARQLVDLGHREIVLTGIFIGAYGHETALRRRQSRPEAAPLAELIDAVARVPGLQRVRLSSMEPGDVSEALLDAMVANQPVVVPHLHLPLQSGCDAVLARMNRQYRVGDYLEMIDQVNEALTTPDGLPPAITTDVICGFPGETEGNFQETVRVAERVGYLHMHVFPFSPRRGTAAARWRDRFLDPGTVKKRVRRLFALEQDPARGLSLRYRRKLLGRRVRVILEQPDPARPGNMTGRCDHYALVSLPTDRARGTLVTASVTRVTASCTLGRVHATTIALPLADRPVTGEHAR